MQHTKATRAAPQTFSTKFWLLAIILVVLLGFALYAKNIIKTLQSSTSARVATPISQSMLEEKYGLRVNLIAVTAAGGMVDLRLKIIDGEKAKAFLQDKTNFPVLVVGNGNVRLNVSEETKSQEYKFDDNSDLFLLFPNAGGAVKSGTSVSVEFGATALEPIIAK